MDMGLPSDERATLQALVDAAAPEPLPADQAIALLQHVSDLDSEALGRLAYRALTGVDPGQPGDPDPPAPSEALPGFPPFAAEVLMRAICGPDHRRPTAQAILIVLDTVPAASWPTTGRPFVVLDEEGPVEDAPVEEAPVEDAPVEDAPVDEQHEAEPTVEVPIVVDTMPATDEIPVPEMPVPEMPVPEVLPEPVATFEARDRDAEFRRLLTPSREIPRFDPLSDPWVPEDAPAPEPAAAVVPEPGEPEVEPEPEPEPVFEAEPEPVFEAEPEPEPEPVLHHVPGHEPVAEPDQGMHSEFRNLVPSTFEVPHFDRLESDMGPLAEDPRRRSSGRRRSTARSTPGTSGSDRRQTLLLVAVIVVLIALGALYVATQKSDETTDDSTPQGASRSTSQPVGVRT